MIALLRRRPLIRATPANSTNLGVTVTASVVVGTTAFIAARPHGVPVFENVICSLSFSRSRSRRKDEGGERRKEEMIHRAARMHAVARKGRETSPRERPLVPYVHPTSRMI